MANKKTQTPDAPAGKEREARDSFWLSTVPKIINYLAMLVSLGLIAFISWDTLKDIDYLEHKSFMVYQFMACMIYLLEYIYRFVITKRKIRFALLTFPFLLICIPYLNLIEYYNISVSREMLTYFCFIPIVRGLVALVMVVTYVTKNMATTVFASYLLVLMPIIYMSGLVFYVAEKSVNPAVKNFWYAQWWAGMNVTTIGCDINPVTGTGMFLSLLLSLLGIIMLPLFTVYFGNAVNRYQSKVKETQLP